MSGQNKSTVKLSALPRDISLCVPSYLQDVFPLGVLLAAQPPLFEEAAQFEAEQQQRLLEVLGLLDQQSPLLAPQLLLESSLEAQTLQLEVPTEQGLLVLLLQLRGGRRLETIKTVACL